jgi:tetratricopeptide (TPR) repeat protein
MEDVFAIQDEIAQNIARALRVMLTEEEKHAITRAETTDVQAYDYYLRGRQYFHQLRRKGLQAACDMFQRAIEIDPRYARAYAGLADCYSLLYQNWQPSEANLTQAETASQKSVEIDSQLAEAHAARGQAISLRKQYTEACRELDIAIRLNPSLFEAHYFYARASVQQGKLADAVKYFEQAAKLRPEDYQAPLLVAAVYRGLGRDADALDAYRRGLAVAERHLQLHPDDARALYLGANALCQLGDRDRGLEWTRRAVAIDPDEPMILYNVACVYALLGQSDDALSSLENAVARAYAHKAWLQHDADLNSIRSSPRFESLLNRL